MESTLHRQLKALYGGSSGEQEARIDGFLIDAVVKGRLIEIQRASLSAIRTKIASLLERHRVTVVKPLAARTFIVRRDRRGGAVISSRYSPLRRSLLTVFEELVHFVGVFPHPRLALEIVLIEQEEHRVTRRRRRFNGPDFLVEDRVLRAIVSKHRFRTAADLAALLPASLPPLFHSADLAQHAGIPRWLAQKMAYCLRKVDGIEVVGKSGNSVLYAAPVRRCRREAA
jgi:hypothetical protein